MIPGAEVTAVSIIQSLEWTWHVYIYIIPEVEVTPISIEWSLEQRWQQHLYYPRSVYDMNIYDIIPGADMSPISGKDIG